MAETRSLEKHDSDPSDKARNCSALRTASRIRVAKNDLPHFVTKPFRIKSFFIA